jgi:hypothetical protein
VRPDDSAITTNGTRLEVCRRVNPDDGASFVRGERAARAGELDEASRWFVKAGREAASEQRWQTATRCYRAALEIDLFDLRLVARLNAVNSRAANEWTAYARALPSLHWPRFGCRGATMVMGTGGARVDCPNVGRVLDVHMSDGDVVDARPDERFHDMPHAMSLVILRRALWPQPQLHRKPMTVRVSFVSHRDVILDELGDWKPV